MKNMINNYEYLKTLDFSSLDIIADGKSKTIYALDKETAINTAQLNCINADIQKYEAQLRQAKLFEFSKKKQLANHIASLRKKVQDVKESEKLKQLQLFIKL